MKNEYQTIDIIQYKQQIIEELSRRNDSEFCNVLNRKVMSHRQKGIKEVLGTVYKKEKVIDNFLMCGEKSTSMICPNGCGQVTSNLKCNYIFCPECGLRRYTKFIIKYKRRMKKWQNPKHMILTLKNKKQITRQDFIQFSTYWKNFREYIKRYNKNKLKNVPNPTNYQIQIKEGIRIYEISNKGKGWHVHMHVLMESNYIQQETISKIWKQVTKHSHIVYIKSVKGKALKQCINYVGAYMTKGHDYQNIKQLIDIYLNVGEIKIMSTFGKTRKIMSKTEKDLRNHIKIHMYCPKCGSKLVFSMDIYSTDKIIKPVYHIHMEVINEQTKTTYKEEIITDQITKVKESIKRGIDQHNWLCKIYNEQIIQKMRHEGIIYENKPETYKIA